MKKDLMPPVFILLLVMHSFGVFAQQVYRVDSEKSKLDWMCGKHNGYIEIHEGTLTMKDGEITGGEFTIAMDSITTLDIDYELMRETLNNLLKSEHYFDSEKYPLSTFKITNSHLIEGDNYCISGNLRIKDQTHTVTFHAAVNIDGNHLTAESEKFFIDRTKWGITTSSENYVKDKNSFTFSDEIYFIIHLVAEKE